MMRDHRRVVEVGVGDPGHEVGGAGPEGRHRHRGAAGQAAVDVGHERGALLVARRDVADGVLPAERVEDVHRLLARHREDVLAALGGEALDEQRGGGPGSVGHAGQSTGRALGTPRGAILRAMTEPRRTGTLLRLAAFTTDPSGGNPAGVWIGEALPADAEMQRIAAEVGYSETAFLAPDGSGRAGRFRVRYFSPLAEVPFCGHATIASGVALAERGLAAPPETRRRAGADRADHERRSGRRRHRTRRGRPYPGHADDGVDLGARAGARAAVGGARRCSAGGPTSSTRRFRRRSGSPARGTSSSPPAISTGWRRLEYPFEAAPGADAASTT